MNTIIIPTTQNIELEYPVASVWERALSAGIDLVVIVAYASIWFVWLVDYWRYDNFVSEAFTTINFLILLPAITYSLWTELWLEGQTIGKRIFRLRTIRLDGASPGVTEYLLRWSLRLIDIWVSASFLLPGLVGFITMSAGRKGQRLGDLAAGTSVVKLRLVIPFSDTIFVETAEDYQVRFPQVSKLSDRDISILKQVLEAGVKSENLPLLNKLAAKVQTVMGIEIQEHPKEFLANVLKDYNHLFRN